MSIKAMQRVIGAVRWWPLWRDRDGVISIETALVGTVLTIMTLGVVDFSMAYTRISEKSCRCSCSF